MGEGVGRPLSRITRLAVRVMEVGPAMPGAQVKKGSFAMSDP